MPATVLFELTIDPTIAPEQVDQILTTILTATAGFPGNLGVEVVQDVADSDRLVVLMRWDDQDAYDQYLQWRRSPEGANELRTLVTAAPTTRRLNNRLTITATDTED